MLVDWKGLLARHGIAFTPSGKRDIVIGCPFCGADDPSQHMAISLRGRGWRCLRRPAVHKGVAPNRLVSALLKCTDERAREILGMGAAAPLPAREDFLDQMKARLGQSIERREPPKQLGLPSEVRPMYDGSRHVDQFWCYLLSRGFSENKAKWAVDNYNLHCAWGGDWRYRIILPIFDENNRLQTWTGRAIRPEAKIRYKTLATELSVIPSTKLLLGLPLLWAAAPARCLVVCEGPFDAIAVSALGAPFGVWGTCLFGVGVSREQAELLDQLSRRFDRTRLLIDPDMYLRLLELRQRLPRSCKPEALPQGLKDPGELVGHPRGGEFVKALAA